MLTKSNFCCLPSIISFLKERLRACGYLKDTDFLPISIKINNCFTFCFCCTVPSKYLSMQYVVCWSSFAKKNCMLC